MVKVQGPQIIKFNLYTVALTKQEYEWNWIPVLANKQDVYVPGFMLDSVTSAHHVVATMHVKTYKKDNWHFKYLSSKFCSSFLHNTFYYACSTCWNLMENYASDL